MQPVRFVSAAHLAPLQIVEELIQHKLHLTDYYGVAVLERLLRHEARVHASHDNRHPASAKCIGDLVAAVHVASHGGDANEICLEIVVDRLDVFIGQDDLVTVARDGSGDGEQARERRVQRSIQVQWPRGQ